MENKYVVVGTNKLNKTISVMEANNNIHRPACCHMEAPVWNYNYLSNQLPFKNLNFLFHLFNRFQLITNSRHVFFNL